MAKPYSMDLRERAACCRWAASGRSRIRRAPDLAAWLRGIRMSPCAVWQGSLANGGSRFVTDGRAPLAPRGPELPFFRLNNCG
jgi:hypothetical protein